MVIVIVLSVLCGLLLGGLIYTIREYQKLFLKHEMHLRMWTHVLEYFAQATDSIEKVASSEAVVAYASKEAAVVCRVAADIAQTMVVVAQRIGSSEWEIEEKEVPSTEDLDGVQ